MQIDRHHHQKVAGVFFQVCIDHSEPATYVGHPAASNFLKVLSPLAATISKRQSTSSDLCSFRPKRSSHVTFLKPANHVEKHTAISFGRVTIISRSWQSNICWRPARHSCRKPTHHHLCSSPWPSTESRNKKAARFWRNKKRKPTPSRVHKWTAQNQQGGNPIGKAIILKKDSLRKDWRWHLPAITFFYEAKLIFVRLEDCMRTCCIS